MILRRSWPKTITVAKRRGRNDEHVDSNGAAHVVAQEAAPGRGGDLGSPRHVSADGRLADHDAELEQFAVDSGRTPEDWRCSFDRSDCGPPCRSWAVPDSRTVIATANRVGSPYDATGSRLPA